MASSAQEIPPNQASLELRPELPLSVVLGAGAVRGLAHIAILEAILESGFKITEMVGTSVGALILAFYAAVGLDLASMRSLGLSLRSYHLLSWALLRHTPAGVRNRCRHWAGVIPEYMALLAGGSFDRMHHGVERIGIVAHDTQTDEQIVCHNIEPCMRLEDAVRGAAALPGLFPVWRCSYAGRDYRLVDGGVCDRLPVEALFHPPFQPVQVLAVDISARPEDRARNLDRIAALRRRFPVIPIDILCAETLGGATVRYRSGYLAGLLESGRRSAVAHLSRLPIRSDTESIPWRTHAPGSR